VLLERRPRHGGRKVAHEDAVGPGRQRQRRVVPDQDARAAQLHTAGQAAEGGGGGVWSGELDHTEAARPTPIVQRHLQMQQLPKCRE